MSARGRLLAAATVLPCCSPCPPAATARRRTRTARARRTRRWAAPRSAAWTR
ncbi:hypothetical protein NKH77_39765 [Streptomyces sp. M19]